MGKERELFEKVQNSIEKLNQIIYLIKIRFQRSRKSPLYCGVNVLDKTNLISLLNSLGPNKSFLQVS